MASHLAKIHGTEEDKVNCPFYYKIGACRHGDRCSRIHHRPAFSQTLLVKHLYQNPVLMASAAAVDGLQQSPDLNAMTGADREKAVEAYLCFYEDLYQEFAKFGRLEEIHIVENVGDHMIGHVYVKFGDEEEASDALQVMHGRYYDGTKMEVEFSPVTDFREARCRDYDEESCSRGGYCNFLHCRPVPPSLIRSLEDDSAADRRRHDQERRDAAKLAAKEEEDEDEDDDDDEEDRRRRKKSKKRKKEHRSHHHHHRSSRRSRSGSQSSGGRDGGGGDGSDRDDAKDDNKKDVKEEPEDDDPDRRERKRSRRDRNKDRDEGSPSSSHHRDRERTIKKERDDGSGSGSKRSSRS